MPTEHKATENVRSGFLLRSIINFVPVLLLVFCFVLCSDSLAKGNKKICLVEALRYPGKNPTMWDGLYAASDGKVYSGLITEGGSAHLYVYDPKTRKNRLLYDIADFLGERGRGVRMSSKIHCQPVEDNEGNIYFATLNNGSGPRNVDFASWEGGHWFKYDPKKEKLEDLGLVTVADGPYPITIDKERLHLFGIGFAGYFYRCDIKNRTSKNLGRVNDWDACRGLFCDDKGNVYGGFPVARMFKYDPQTEKVYDLSIKIPYDPTIYPARLNNPRIDRTCDWRTIKWDPIEKVAYGITCGSGSILFKYDPHKGPEGEITPLTQLCDRKFLGRKDVPYSTLAFALDSKNRKIYFAPSARRYAIERYIETFGSDAPHHLLVYDMKTKKVTDLGIMRATTGERVFGCEGASVAPDGTVYLCGQVECKDPMDATRHTRTDVVPLSLRLIIYKPESKRFN
jgi:hypothetical protein